MRLMCRCTILLKPAISIFHFQQCDKLFDDILVDISRHSGRKENWANDVVSGDIALNSNFLRVQAAFMERMRGLTQPKSVIAGIDIARMMKPNFITKINPTQNHHATGMNKI